MAINMTVKNISLIYLNDLFYRVIQNHIYDDLKEYVLLDKPLSNKDVKKIYYHHMIHNIIEAFLDNKQEGKPILIFCNTYMPPCDLLGYYTDEDLLDFIERFIDKLEKMLPIRIVVTSYELKESLGKEIQIEMLINACLIKSQDISAKNYTFEKIKSFAKQYQLSYLDNDYLNRIRTKQILI